MYQLKVRPPDWTGVIESLVTATKAQAVEVLEAVGKEMVEWLESRTVAERGWVSRSGDLAKGYRYKVTKTETGARLTLRNVEFYAAILEHRDGLFVLTGVTDPGGPVEEKLTEVAAKYGWKIVRAGA